MEYFLGGRGDLFLWTVELYCAVGGDKSKL